VKGAHVLVTRAAEEAGEMEDLLRARGAVPVRMPCIEFEDGPDIPQIVQIVQNARTDLIVVSSPHAARRLIALVGNVDIPFATVGAGTAALLPGRVVVPKSGTGADALLAELAGQVRGKRVLVPRAERGTPALIDGLNHAGALVEVLTLYRTVAPKGADPAVLRRLRDGGIDAITFASGSAVRGFIALAGAGSAARSAVVCLGGSSAGAAKAAGMRIRSSAADLSQLCDAVEAALSTR
jgi:uroporphyrinogen III methyltransferase/synthase